MLPGSRGLAARRDPTLITLTKKRAIKMNRLAIIALVALGFATPVNAEPMPYDLDAGHSRIWFDVNHQGYSIMLGLFRDYGGTFN